MNSPMIDIITRKAPREVLLNILNSNEKAFPSRIAKEIDVTYSHVVKLLLAMKVGGLVHFDKNGRKKFVGLTPHGKEVATLMSQTKTLLND